ncbi:hypothetical protein GOV06_02770 [Candidatus Woesearchaeota archaeon]|nr:hypothetical protein [Candidatus Woesearchaeota archaeon]
METNETQEKTLQEIVVYGHVSTDAVLDNRYLKGSGIRPTFSFVAEQYGCQVEFRDAVFRKDHFDGTQYVHGAQDGDVLTALVLLGEDREQLRKAREDILITFGYSKMNPGRTDISSEKSERWG